MTQTHSPDAVAPAVQRLASRVSELGAGLVINRALPARQRRTVGAWCFLDHIGPITFAPDAALHVGAHPHTCLQTFTWMLEGEIRHRDSLGHDQVIRPGQVNLMTAGRGIVHTEDSVASGGRLHAAQLWIALPPAQAGCDPAFGHYPDLPHWQQSGCGFTLLVGDYAGRTAPTPVHSPLLGLDLACGAAPSTVTLALQPGFEYGLLVLEGEAWIGPECFVQEEFAYWPPGTGAVTLVLAAGTRALLIGGEPLPEPIVMWWNFVAYHKDDLVAAQSDWESGAARFGRVPGDGGLRLTAPALPWS